MLVLICLRQEPKRSNLLSDYLSRLSQLADSTINCGPVLSWLELDNRGHRLIVTEDNAINTPAVAAAYAIRRYVAQAADEITFEVSEPAIGILQTIFFSTWYICEL